MSRPSINDSVPYRERQSRKRNQGRLAALMEESVDIFLEVAKRAHPSDLITLSRTTKHLRALLLSRKMARDVWRESLCRQLRLSLGSLELPEGMTEPELARLLFGRECYNCLGFFEPTFPPFYARRIRLCHKCRADRSVLIGWMDRSHLMRVFTDLTRRHSVGSYLSPPVMLLEAKGRLHVLVSDLKRVILEATAIEVEDPAACGAYLAQQLADISRAQEEERRIKSWITNFEKVIRDDFESVVNRRLLELGWTAELLGLVKWRHSKQWLKLARQGRAMNNGVWENLRPKLEVILQAYSSQNEPPSIDLVAAVPSESPDAAQGDVK